MPNQVQLVRQAVASLMVCGLIASLLSSFAAALCAQTVDPESVLGDTTIPSPEDVSQNFPYGITGKTPPSLIKINYEGQKPYHKHRINLRLFQGCPQVEISEGGRLWATWFGSNVQAERAPYHKGQFSVISTSSDGGKTWKEVFVFDPSELLGGGASDPMLWKDPKGNIRFIGLRNVDFRGKDEFAYIVYDQGRGVIGQHTIFLSKITEEDILAGKLVKDESFLNNIVSRPSDQGGGRREGDKI